MSAKGSEGYLPRNLTLPMQELVPLRARLLQATLAGFCPHLVVVDRHATGVHGELETALRRASAAGSVRVVLGLREVLDSPAAAAAEWARVGGPRVVKALFDAIWVYGDPAVHDPVAAGEIPFALRKLIRYTGYLAEGRPSASGTSCMPGRYCMTTVGGGSDGYALAQRRRRRAGPGRAGTSGGRRTADARRAAQRPPAAGPPRRQSGARGR